MASNLVGMASNSNLLAMASSLLGMASNLQPTSDGLQPNWKGLLPNSKDLLPILAMASNLGWDGETSSNPFHLDLLLLVTCPSRVLIVPFASCCAADPDHEAFKRFGHPTLTRHPFTPRWAFSTGVKGQWTT